MTELHPEVPGLQAGNDKQASRQTDHPPIRIRPFVSGLLILLAGGCFGCFAYAGLRYSDPMKDHKGFDRWTGIGLVLLSTFVMTMLTYGLGSLEGWWR